MYVAALPWPYFTGISNGDLGDALLVLGGRGCLGALSPGALGRLKAQWSEIYRDWASRWLEDSRCVLSSTFLGLAFKLVEEAANTWRRIRTPEKVAELLG